MTDRELSLRRLRLLSEYWQRRCAHLLDDVTHADQQARAELAQGASSLSHKLDEARTKLDVLEVARPEQFALGEADAARAFAQTASAFASLDRRLRQHAAAQATSA